MGAVIKFPAARIVRPLKKRVARPRKWAAAVENSSERINRVAELVIERALCDGQTLTDIARCVYAKDRPTDAGDPLMQKINIAVKAELRKRMGPAAVIPMSVRFSAQWPAGSQGESLDELARLGYEACMRRTGNDTMEKARKRALESWKEMESEFRDKYKKDAAP